MEVSAKCVARRQGVLDPRSGWQRSLSKISIVVILAALVGCDPQAYSVHPPVSDLPSKDEIAAELPLPIDGDWTLSGSFALQDLPVQIDHGRIITASEVSTKYVFIPSGVVLYSGLRRLGSTDYGLDDLTCSSEVVGGGTTGSLYGGDLQTIPGTPVWKPCQARIYQETDDKLVEKKSDGSNLYFSLVRRSPDGELARNSAVAPLLREPLGSISSSQGGGRILRFQEGIPYDLVKNDEIFINDRRIRVQEVDAASNTVTLGNQTGQAPNLIQNGLNRIRRNGIAARDELLYWSDSIGLSRFQNPYNNSYAVLVAIDDYGRKKQPGLGKTGFGTLGRMVSGAEQLKSALIKLGFPSQNVITFYDDRADSQAINTALASFWTGGPRSGADRFFFYFGGHGSSHNGDGLLVTYDYDPSRPTLTSLLMSDLAGRHSNNIEAHHALFALDACGSGLTVGHLGDQIKDRTERRTPRQLAVIRNDTQPRARNLLLAGTGDQPALYDNGGIFTRALVDGLNGEADLNHDGIIQFTELGLYVKDEVAQRAAGKGEQQTADYRKLTERGATGEMLFLRY